MASLLVRFLSRYIYRSAQTGGGYTAYIKIGIPAGPGGGVFPFDVGAGTQRCVWRTTSVDGSQWTTPTLVAAADWRDGGGDQVVELTTTDDAVGAGSGALVNGGGNATQIGFFTMFHANRQQIDLQVRLDFMISQ